MQTRLQRINRVNSPVAKLPYVHGVRRVCTDNCVQTRSKTFCAHLVISDSIATTETNL